MARIKRTSFQRERDRDFIAQRYLIGRTQREIAADLGLTQQQISYDLRMIQRAWIESSIRSFALKRAEEIAKIGQLEHDYWKSWRESKETSEGNPAFLLGVQWCIKQRCSIYGFIPWRGLSRAQIDELDEMIERELERACEAAKKEAVN